MADFDLPNQIIPPRPAAKVEDADGIAAGVNRTVQARQTFGSPIRRDLTTAAPTAPAPSLMNSRTPIQAPLRNNQFPTTDTVNPVTGLVRPEFNLGGHFDRPDFTSVATPSAVAPVATATTPAVTTAPVTRDYDFGPSIAALEGGAAPAQAQPSGTPQGFTLQDFLSSVGPSESGFANLGLLGVGSQLVSQRQGEIATQLGREQGIAREARASDESVADIAYKQALTGQAEATGEKIGFENIVSRLQATQGQPAGQTGSFAQNIIPADPITGTPAMVGVLNRQTGQTEFRPIGDAGSVAGQAPGQAGNNAVALQLQMMEALRAEDPNFASASDEVLRQEVQRRITQGAQ